MRRIKQIIYESGILSNEFINALINNLILVVIPIVLLFMGFSSLLFIISYLAYLMFLIIKHKKEILILTIILSFLLSLSFIIHNQIYDVNNHMNEIVEYEGLIIDKLKYENNHYNDKHYNDNHYDDNHYYRYVVRKRNYIFFNKSYVYSKEEFEIGEYIKCIGIVKEIDGEKIEHQFNYERYLNHSKIRMVINSDEIEKIDNKFTFHIIKKIVYRYLDNNFEGDTKSLIKGLILGDTSEFDDNLKEALKINGVLHLFAISGLHVNLFISLFVFIFRHFKLKDEIIEKIILIFLFLYLVLTTFAVSIFRASLMYLFQIINKKYFVNFFSSIDVISIVFFVLLLINPYYAYNIGFILSFLVSFIILLLQALLKGKNNSFQIFIISLICNLFTLPVIININYEYNIISPIFNVLYINIVSIIILPLSLMTIVFPPLALLFDYVVLLFFNLIDLTSKINLPLRLPYFNNLSLFLYYLLLIVSVTGFKKIKKISALLLIIFIISLNQFGSFTFKPKVDFLYLNDGEASIIRCHNDVIVIDTGNGHNDEVLEFLLSKGIRKIDYLIITHDHDDHCGSVNTILQKIKVNHILLSCYSIQEYDNKEIVLANQKIKFGCFEMDFLAPIKEGREENDNSIIMVLNINYNGSTKNILFTGDATINEEREIIEKLKLTYDHIDIIKVGHHGSNTSTCDDLLNAVKIDYAVIMVGEERKKTHPNTEVINRLSEKGIKIFSTIECYSMSIELIRDEVVFYTLKE